MRNVLILGAGGRIARRLTKLLADDNSVHLTLFARSRDRLGEVPEGVDVIEGDVLDKEALWEAVGGQEVVYAGLVGEVDKMAEAIVTTMTGRGVTRLIFTAALGIHDEVPGEFGEWNREQLGGALEPYRKAVEEIAGSAIDYTVLRPAWFIEGDEVDYAVTKRDEEFRGTVVTRQSVAALAAEIIRDPALYSREDLGVAKPGTEKVRPVFAAENKDAEEKAGEQKAQEGRTAPEGGTDPKGEAEKK